MLLNSLSELFIIIKTIIKYLISTCHPRRNSKKKDNKSFGEDLVIPLEWVSSDYQTLENPQPTMYSRISTYPPKTILFAQLIPTKQSFQFLMKGLINYATCLNLNLKSQQFCKLLILQES